MTGRIDTARRAAVAAAYAGGAALRQVAAQFSLSHETVRRFVRDEGIVLRPRRRHRDAARDAAMVEAYSAGGSLRGVAQRFGVSYETVRLALIQQGNQSRPHGGGGAREGAGRPQKGLAA